MDSAFPILPAIFRDAADIPLTIPKLTVADFFHVLRHFGIFFHILFFSQIAGRFKEALDRPIVQEGYHGTFTASQVQTVIPVSAQTLAHAVGSHLSGGKVQDPFHVVIDSSLIFVSIRHHLLKQIKFPCLFYILHNGADQPQRVIRAGVLQAVDHLIPAGCGHHCGGFEGLHFRIRVKPFRLEQVQAIPLRHLAPQKLYDPLTAFFRV